MSEAKRKLKVFLCHASTDKARVLTLYEDLLKYGIQPWLDDKDILLGQEWQIEIPKAISSSDVVIICLSKRAVDKVGYVQSEIKFALDKAHEMPEGRIFIIPVLLEECEVPFSLRRYQWVNLFGFDVYLKFIKLIDSLEKHAVQLNRTPVKKKYPKSNLNLNWSDIVAKTPRSLWVIISAVIFVQLVLSMSITGTAYYVNKDIDNRYIFFLLGSWYFPVQFIIIMTTFEILLSILRPIFAFITAFREYLSLYKADSKE